LKGPTGRINSPHSLLRAGAAARYRAPLHTRTAITAIHGRDRVEGVSLRSFEDGATRRVACDTVVFTADWIPDHELAVLAGIGLDPGTRGPVVDAALRTERPGVFAAGNVNHGAEAADVAALAGRHAAAAVAAYVRDGAPWPARSVPLRCAPPLHWVVPNAVAAHAGPPPRGRFVLRAHAFLEHPEIEVVQDGRRLWHGHLRRVQPGRSVALAAGWTGAVDPTGGPVDIRVLRARPAGGAVSSLAAGMRE